MAQITDISEKLRRPGRKPEAEKQKLMLQQFCGKYNFQEKTHKNQAYKADSRWSQECIKAREKISKRVTAGTSKEELKGLW